MTIETFISELEANLVGATPGSLRPDTRFRELPYWDSLAALSMLATYDSVFGRQLTGEMLARCETIDEVVASASA
jgi:acyl carrier protein